MPLLIALLAALLLTACGEEEPPRRAATPTATSSPTAAPAPERRGEPVRFRSADGRNVRGVLGRSRADAPAVILLHQYRADLSQWDAFAPVLRRAGYTTLAYDDRGSLDETELVGDLEAAVRYLRRGRPRLRVGVIGASIGASTALYAGASRLRAQLDAVVAMSPADSSPLIELQTTGRYRPHDLLLVSDRRESVTTENLLEGARRTRRFVSEQKGHGVELLGDPQVESLILSWLDRRLR
jgi:pimeloyl-ACP methyl ester carboxylesterase